MSSDQQVPGASQQPPGAPDTHSFPDCYRHPGRETGVGCTRCGRPVCPDCRVEAAVGFQCRDCLRGGAAEVRQARTEFGGGLARDGALITKILIGINVAVWLLHFQLSWEAYSHLYMWGPGVADGEYYRLITSVFFHTAPLHIAMNMWGLWVLGPPLERLLGRWRFLALYLVSGLAGSALVLLVAPGVPTLGASGAIFGLFGAMVVIQRKRGYALGPVLALLVVNLVATFTIPNISWEGHVGGLVAGALVAFGLAHAPQRNRSLVQAGAVLAVLGAVAVLTAVGVAGLN